MCANACLYIGRKYDIPVLQHVLAIFLSFVDFTCKLGSATQQDACVKVVACDLLSTQLETHQIACVEALLEAGVDANSSSQLSGDTAIAMAAYHGLDKAILLLIENGGDPHATDECGRNAVFAAASSGSVECTKILLVRWHTTSTRRHRARAVLLMDGFLSP